MSDAILTLFRACGGGQKAGLQYPWMQIVLNIEKRRTLTRQKQTRRTKMFYEQKVESKVTPIPHKIKRLIHDYSSKYFLYVAKTSNYKSFNF